MFWLYLLLSFLAGILLGVFFFGGLWWTVQKITGSGRPYLISVASFIVRTIVVLVGFYYLLQAGWQFLFAALFGFLIARTTLAYKLKPGNGKGKESANK
jgi:F1F0 ATPase subunit 2